MQYLIVAGIQRNMTDYTILSTEQHQITCAQIRDTSGNGAARMRHLTRSTWEFYSMLAIDVLNET